MSVTLILLNENEEYVSYIDPDRTEIVETREKQGVDTIEITYSLDEDDNPDDMFQQGNKIWVHSDSLSRDCLYVINTKVEIDIDDHFVKFEAEEVLVELNYVPPTSQTYVTSSNFNLSSGNVIVDRKALTFWFSEYYKIGVVQNCLSTALSKIKITGTIGLMELLRKIEEETGNIFTTQYEKDPYTNEIHRYLNFLNPNNQNSNWNFLINYQFPIVADDPEVDTLVGEYTSEDDETDYDEDEKEIIISTLPAIDPTATCLKLLSKNGDTIMSEQLDDIGVTGDEDEIDIYIQYAYSNSAYVLSVQVNSVVWSVEDEEYSTITGDENTIAEDPLNFLPDRFTLQLINEDDKITYFEHDLTPILSSTHSDILDLGYNVEDLNLEIDETDTYMAVAPVLTASEDEYTASQINTIASAWLNLSVTKGDVIPMIIEKVTNNSSSPSSSVSSNYWSRCINNQASSGYDCWHGTAYWVAPFNKRAGEMWIEDETENDVSYDRIVSPSTGRLESYPKTELCDCNDENAYAIYNQLALRLKNIRTKNINVETEVANLKDGKFNDYNINDKVYVKIPNSSSLVTAIVKKTVKNAHVQSENTVELDNYSINNKFVPAGTYITSNNISYTYPAKGKLSVTLRDMTTDNGIGGKLVSISINQVENNQTTYVKSIHLTTDSQGKVEYTDGLNPGEYAASITFGGDETYESCSGEYYINVGGTIPVEQKTTTSAKKTNNKTAKKSSKKGTKKVKVKRYYTQYGLSPDSKHKYICAIGRPSASGEASKYGYKFYKVVFYNKCPACGKASLYWGIFWAGNETGNWGTFPATGRQEGGSAEGHIFCKSCDADYSIFGKSHDNYNRQLKVYKKATKSSKNEAYKLKKGKLYYDTITKTVKTKKNTTTKDYTPLASIDKTVKEKAKAVAKGKTGLAAAKLIAYWVAKNIRYCKPRYDNFAYSPASVLKRGSGNCCDQTRLMLTMMDAVGVTQKYKLTYIHTRKANGEGHVFARINGKYVDPCKTRTPWGHYVTGYGRIGSAPSSTYPTRPF